MKIIVEILFLTSPLVITITASLISAWMKGHCVLKCGDKYYVYAYEHEHYRLYNCAKYTYYYQVQKIDDGVYEGVKKAHRHKLGKVDDYYYWSKIIWREN